jgi:glycosyltransferase involved in cell wall biosynthesis
MKIAMITTDRRRGGILLAFVNYAECILQLGHELVVMVPHDASDLIASIRSRCQDRCRIVSISPAEIMAMRRLGWAPPRLRSALRGSDALIIHNNFLCRPLAGADIPVIAICHNDKWNGLRASAKIVFLSKTAAGQFSREADEAGLAHIGVEVIPHYFETTTDSNPYPSKPGQPFTVSTAGRLVRNKGFRDFIVAAGALNREGRSIEFILAGEGEDQRDLAALAKTDGAPVDFPGWMDIGELADRSHLFCLTSRQETFGYVLCEMMDRGVPCISTPTNGPEEILGGDGAGVFYPAGHPDLLADRIREFHQSTEYRREQSRKAFERIREPAFSKALFIERLAALLDV